MAGLHQSMKNSMIVLITVAWTSLGSCHYQSVLTSPNHPQLLLMAPCCGMLATLRNNDDVSKTVPLSLTNLLGLSHVVGLCMMLDLLSLNHQPSVVKKSLNGYQLISALVTRSKKRQDGLKNL